MAPFSVSICNVSARHLHPRDGLTNDAYVLFDFGGFYKFKTPVCEKNLNPDWNFCADFIYKAKFPHKLHHEFLTVTVFDSPPFSEDKIIGGTRVDLHTIATGPIHHQLSLLDTARNRAGTILFDVHCNQLLRDMMCELSNLTIPTWESRGCDPNTSLQLQCFFSESASKVETSKEVITSDALPFFPYLPDLKLDTDANSLREEKSHVVIIVNVIVNDVMKEYARATLNVLDQYRCDEQPVRFALPLCDATGDVSSIFGDVYLTNGPQFLQMAGRPSDALNHDEGVSYAGFVLRGFPLPNALQGNNITKNSTVTEAKELSDIQASIAAKPVKVKLAGVPFPSYTASETEQFLNTVSAPKESSNVLLVEPVCREILAEDYIVALPAGWAMRTDKFNKVFFRHCKSGATTWQDPRFLPADWVQLLTGKGKVYFAQLSSRNTTWVDPRGLPNHWSCTLQKGSHDMVYIFKHKAGPLSKSSVDPRGLMDGCTQHIDSEKEREYFQNSVTETTTWDDPRKSLPRSKLIALRVGQRRKWEMKMLAKAAKRNKAVLAVRGKKPQIPTEVASMPAAKREEFEKRLTDIYSDWDKKKGELDTERQKWFRSKFQGWRDIQVSVEQSWSSKAGQLRREKEQLEKTQSAKLAEWEQKFMEEMERQKQALLEDHTAQLNQLALEQSKVKASMLAHREEGLRHLEQLKNKAVTQRLIQYRMELLGAIKKLETSVEALAIDYSAN